LSDPNSQSLVRRIHDAPGKVVLAVTGGGSGAIAELLQVPGASRTLIEALVPYAAGALDEFLGGAPDGYCSSRTARAMAMTGFQHGLRLFPDEAQGLLGVGCTASLTSDRPKRGPHRVHLALQSCGATVHQHVRLAKGARSRPQEEKLVTALVLNLLAEGCGIEPAAHLNAQLREDEPLNCERKDAPPSWRQLLLGQNQALRIGRDANEAPRSSDAGERTDLVLLCGAFNPLHAGHRRMAEVAEARCGVPAQLELSLTNVDKPPLDYLEIERRLTPLSGSWDVWLTRAATFAEKCELFPRATFVVGADTIVRIADDRYYGHDPARRDAAIARLVERGCRFLVYGRQRAGCFEVLGDLALPPALAKLCEEVPEGEFREDISSTALRASGLDSQACQKSTQSTQE